MADLDKTFDKTEYTTNLGDVPNDIDSADILVGGKEAKFLPNVNVSKWKDGAFLNLNLSVMTVAAQKETFKDKKIELSVGDEKFSCWVLNDGVLEFSVTFDSQPITKSIIFGVQHRGLSFHYQGELDPIEDADATRPDNVIGSYAVYFNKRNNKYKTGKFCHLYRWKVTDSIGKWAWCDPLKYEDNQLIIGLPADFMKTAQYPVLAMGADDTLGATGQGGSQSSSKSVGSAYTAVDGTLDGSGKAYIHEGAGTGGTEDIDIAVYQDNSTNPGTLIDSSDASEVSLNAWQLKQSDDVTGLSGTLEAAHTLHWICISRSLDIECNWRFDTGGNADASFNHWGAHHLNWGNSPDHSDDGTTRDYSVYVDYSEAGGGISIPVAMYHYRAQQ